MSAHDPLPLYVTGALPDDEREAFERHLSSCAQCQHELAAYGPALDELAAAVDTPPPEGMRASVLRAAAATRQDPAGAEAPHGRSDARTFAAGSDTATSPRAPRDGIHGDGRPRDPLAPGGSHDTDFRGDDVRDLRSSRAARRFAVAAAVLAFAFVAATAALAVLWDRAADLQRQVAGDAAAQLTEVLTADDARLVDLDSDLSGTLRVAVAPSLGRGVVLGDGVEAPPDQRTYQLWLLENDQARSAGLLAGGDGVLATLDGLGAAEAVALSVEPSSGSQEPTGPIVARGALN